MNKYLRQLFTAVIALFVVLGMSTTIITAIRANSLSSDPRNARALYQEYGAPRGAILASDGTILAQSTPVNDVFSYQRSYTNGPVYAPVTGFFSVTQRGDRGIESSRNKLLSGKADALFWDQLKSLFTGVENKGASIETSINPKLQQLAYQQLGSNDGAAVVIEVKTGRILTLASAPSYDPNALATHDTKKATANYSKLAAQANSPMINRAASQLYPPGSTFKTIVAATALESGDYDTDTQIPAGASYTLPGTSTNLTNTTTAANGIDGKITLQDALTYSSNTAFAQLGVKLGQDKIAEQAKKLGYGSSITIDGTSSSGRPMKSVAAKFPDTLSDDKVALASIGQGDVLVTPLQVACAYAGVATGRIMRPHLLKVAAAIANDGKLMRPTLVDRVRASDLSTLSETTPEVMSTAFSSSTASKLNQMMQSVVEHDAPSLQLSGIKVAAKTGTAQIGSSNQTNDAWVIGFAPADNPKIAVSVVIHNVNQYGVEAAGPIMRSLMEEALKQ